MLVLGVANTGNVPILPEDFIEPLATSLGGSAKAFSVDVSETRPNDLHPEVEVENGRLLIRPLLLNPGDSMDVAALVADYDGDAQLTGRVVGISELEDRPPRSPGRLASRRGGAIYDRSRAW